MATRTSRAVALAGLFALGAAVGCARADAKSKPQPAALPAADAAPTPSAPKSRPRPDGGSPGEAGALPVAEVGDCPAICGKLLQCKAGPFDSLADCSDACEGSIDDRRTAKTYRCVAKARDCSGVKACAK